MKMESISYENLVDYKESKDQDLRICEEGEKIANKTEWDS